MGNTLSIAFPRLPGQAQSGYFHIATVGFVLHPFPRNMFFTWCSSRSYILSGTLPELLWKASLFLITGLLSQLQCAECSWLHLREDQILLLQQQPRFYWWQKVSPDASHHPPPLPSQGNESTIHRECKRQRRANPQVQPAAHAPINNLV